MSNSPEKRVRAIGGVFFRSKDPQATRDWYAKHLGLGVDDYGSTFVWRQGTDPDKQGFTQWSAFSDETEYFGKQDQQFMINYRVDNLDSLLAQLREEGVEIVGETQNEEYGKFAHVVDEDGRRVELWEPVDKEYAKMVGGTTE